MFAIIFSTESHKIPDEQSWGLNNVTGQTTKFNNSEMQTMKDHSLETSSTASDINEDPVMAMLQQKFEEMKAQWEESQKSAEQSQKIAEEFRRRAEKLEKENEELQQRAKKSDMTAREPKKNTDKSMEIADTLQESSDALQRTIENKDEVKRGNVAHKLIFNYI